MRVWRALLLAFRGFARDDGSALAGYMAYAALLSLFPFLIFTVSLLGLLIGPEGVSPTLDFLFDTLPEHVAQTLEPVVTEVLRGGSGSALSLSAIGAIWIASNGVEALRMGLERAYNVGRSRPFWRNRLISMLFVFGGVAAFLSLALLILFGPLLATLAGAYLGATTEALELWHILRYVAGGGLLLLSVFVLHKALPAGRRDGPIWPGVLLTVVIWMALASGFSIYLQNAPSYSLTYGALGGVIATLLFFYVSSMGFIFGAEINAAVGALRRLSPPAEH